MRRQRDEALKHCGDVLRALQQVSQAVGKAGNVSESQRSDYDAMKSGLDSAPLIAKKHFVPSFTNGSVKVKSPLWIMGVT